MYRQSSATPTILWALFLVCALTVPSALDAQTADVPAPTPPGLLDDLIARATARDAQRAAIIIDLAISDAQADIATFVDPVVVAAGVRDAVGLSVATGSLAAGGASTAVQFTPYLEAVVDGEVTLTGALGLAWSDLGGGRTVATYSPDVSARWNIGALAPTLTDALAESERVLVRDRLVRQLEVRDEAIARDVIAAVRSVVAAERAELSAELGGVRAADQVERALRLGTVAPGSAALLTLEQASSRAERLIAEARSDRAAALAGLGRLTGLVPDSDMARGAAASLPQEVASVPGLLETVDPARATVTAAAEVAALRAREVRQADIPTLDLRASWQGAFGDGVGSPSQRLGVGSTIVIGQLRLGVDLTIGLDQPGMRMAATVAWQQRSARRDALETRIADLEREGADLDLAARDQALLGELASLEARARDLARRGAESDEARALVELRLAESELRRERGLAAATPRDELLLEAGAAELDALLLQIDLEQFRREVTAYRRESTTVGTEESDQ